MRSKALCPCSASNSAGSRKLLHTVQPGDSAVVLFEEGIALQELQDGRPATKGGKATPLVPSELRTGLPINFLASSGLHAGGRPQKGGSTDGDSSVSAQSKQSKE